MNAPSVKLLDTEQQAALLEAILKKLDEFESGSRAGETL